MLKSIVGKVSRFLLEEKDKNDSLTFRLPMNREKLADFLNVSRPSMSRELCRLRDQGIIDFHKDHFRIRDEERLKALLEE
jgi:CRP-like cAMP-binding protein